MILYVDSSVLVSILFAEKGFGAYEAALGRADTVVSSNLTEAEVLATAARENVPREPIVRSLEELTLCFPDRSLAGEYNLVFACSYCRGGDAYHLATALYLDPSRREIVFLTADKVQKRVAVKLGFRTSLP